MPIKETNTRVIFTLSLEENKMLERITDDLSHKIGLQISKSQALRLLIRNYETKPNNTTEQPKTKPSASLNYGAQIRALKDKLNASYNKLALMLDIPASTLKKYASDTQQPKAENKQKIINALKRYGIK